MNRHEREQRRRRLAIAAVVVGCTALLVALINLAGSGDDSDATAAPRPSTTPTGKPLTSFEGGKSSSPTPVTPSPGASGPLGVGVTQPPGRTNLSAGLKDRFVGTTGAAAMHTVTLSITTDQPARWAYSWRDSDGPGDQVTESGETVTRRFRTHLPAGVIALQLSGTGGTASCSVTIDGVKYSTYTASGPYRIVLCQG